MKKVYLILAAAAGMTITSCSTNDYVGDVANGAQEIGDGTIQFSHNLQKLTRADQTGADAATTLGNTFYVYGIKTESTDGAGAVGTGHTVFKNSVVKYEANTAYTTTSNTKDWEYVGKSLSSKEAANITANDGTDEQTIKYWDYSAPDYTFYAFSAKYADLYYDKISVVKNQTVTTSVYNNGYNATLAEGADIDKLFFSERVRVTKSTGTDRTAVNTYGGNVTFRFHNAATKVRVGMYETIDGYTVTINKFSVDNDGANPAFGDMTDDVTANFAANLTNSKGGDAGTLTVTYYDNTDADTENKPILSFAPTTANKVLSLGTNLAENTVLNTSIASPTYDKVGGLYTSVFPNKDNAQNLKLKLTYTLTAPGTGETITVTNATAEIPADYLKWKPGYAYTYIFKISANTNGSTGTPGVDPTGLYPITFDAVATVNEDGLAEYITTVSEPSITTFGVKSGKYVVGKTDYETGTDIYATIVDNSSVADFTFNSQAAGGVNVYKVTTSDADNFPITEASIAESLAELSAGAKKITCENVNADGTTNFTTAPAKVAAVPSEDGGVDITIKALKLTGVKTVGKYAVEYVKTPATYYTSSAAYTFADASAMAAEVSANGALYSNADGTIVATWEDDTEHTYYRRTAVKTVGVYSYKIITVVAP